MLPGLLRYGQFKAQIPVWHSKHNNMRYYWPIHLIHWYCLFYVNQRLSNSGLPAAVHIFLTTRLRIILLYYITLWRLINI